MLSIQNISLLLTTLFAGLVAGLLYGYSCSVNPGLRNLPDSQYLAAMQSINKAIQNPVFFSCFLGVLVLFPVSCRLLYTANLPSSFYFLLAAGFFYLIGVFGITILGNVPLNEQLDKFDIGSSADRIQNMRQQFESSWNRLHAIRTIASIISFCLCMLGILKSRL